MHDRPPLLPRETGMGERVLLIHGSFSDAESTFGAQAALADRYRLAWIERRGAGKGPSATRVDFEVDADDLIALLAEPAHLIAHSYGAIGAIQAAARCPDAVRSLLVIEPPFYRAAENDPAVQALLPKLAAVYANADARDPELFWREFRSALGYEDAASVARPDWWEAAARAAMTERPPWEAELPSFEWSQARFPRCVVSGDWANAPATARANGGAALGAVARALASLLHAEHVVIPGVAHNPQRRAEVMNPVLLRFFERGTPQI